MDGKNPDGEITEFRPWSQFEHTPAFDWRPYLAAGVAVLVLGSGWLAWRGAPSGEKTSGFEPKVVETSSPTIPAGGTPAEAVPVDSPDSTVAPPLLSEADLMAAVSAPPDLALVAAAEEAVIRHFTATPDSEAAAPGYVEWARAVGLDRLGEVTTVAVRFSVIVLSEEPWRLPARTVEVTLRTMESGWQVVGLPRLETDEAEFHWEGPALEEIPVELRAEFEAAGWTVLGGVATGEGWDVAVADPTGAAMMISAGSLPDGR